MKKTHRGVSRDVQFALDYPDAVLAQDNILLRRQTPKSVGLLPPGGPGYGGTNEWPFDWNQALTQTGYRTGIRNALQNPRFNVSWRAAAREKLKRCLDYAITVQQELEAAYTALTLEDLYDAVLEDEKNAAVE